MRADKIGQLDKLGYRCIENFLDFLDFSLDIILVIVYVSSPDYCPKGQDDENYHHTQKHIVFRHILPVPKVHITKRGNLCAYSASI